MTLQSDWQRLAIYVLCEELRKPWTREVARNRCSIHFVESSERGVR